MVAIQTESCDGFDCCRQVISTLSWMTSILGPSMNIEAIYAAFLAYVPVRNRVRLNCIGGCAASLS